jgi:tetratricopeptide (TPR) repeat protein
MDPITSAFVTALANGAAAQLTTGAGQAIKDAYNRLVSRIQDRHPAVNVAQLEKNPGSKPRQAILAGELERANVASDPELLQLAQALIVLVKEQDSGACRSIGVDIGELNHAIATFGKVHAGPDATGARIERVTGSTLAFDEISANSGTDSTKGKSLEPIVSPSPCAAIGAVFGKVTSGARQSIGTINVGATASDVAAAVTAAYEPQLVRQSDKIAELSRALGIAEVTIDGFLNTLQEAQVTLEQAPAKFQELAVRYRQLVDDVRALQSEDPEVQELRARALAAIETGPTCYNRADEYLERAERIDREATEKLETGVEARKLSGAASRSRRGELSLVRLDYRAAIMHFKAALLIVPAAHPEVSRRYSLALAGALHQCGEDEGKNEALVAAVDVLRSVLRAISCEHEALDWAKAQNDLGCTLQVLGAREIDNARLEEAVAAYRSALEKRPREHVPTDWATTQNNLAGALWCLGQRDLGTARLEQAVTAYRSALEERTRERAPLYWAETQNGLGNALLMLGRRESGTARLREAVTAYRSALEERTRERVPMKWAGTQNNLGNALLSLGEEEEGTPRFDEAVAAYRSVLLEYTRERVPLDWAMTQNNLGVALSALGTREPGTASLEAAVDAYRNALLEYIRDRVPLDWATTQNNLGNALRRLGERETGTGRLEEAVTAYRSALLELTHEGEHTPYYQLMAELNLCRATKLLEERRDAAGSTMP